MAFKNFVDSLVGWAAIVRRRRFFLDVDYWELETFGGLLIVAGLFTGPVAFSKLLSSWRIDEKHILYAVAVHFGATTARPGCPATGGT